MLSPMTNFSTLTWFLLGLLLLCLALGCDDDEMAFVPMEPEPLECFGEFEPNAAGTDCICPPDKIQLDTIICYTLPEGFWHADMDGCPYTIGLSFGQGPSSSPWSLTDLETAASYGAEIDAYRFGIEALMWRRHEPSNGQVLDLHPESLFLLNSATGYDSIIFTLDGPEWALPDKPIPPAARFQFRGKMLHPDTLVGDFYWGYEDWLDGFPIANTDSCQGVFIRPSD
jgi:hypothetical protein